MLIQALVTEAAVEALDVCVLDRFSRTDEVQPHPALIGPGIEYLALELRPVVDRNRQRQPAQIGEALENRRNTPAIDRCIDLERQTLAAVVVNDRKTPELPTIDQAVSDEIHRPAAIHSAWLRQRFALKKPNSLALSPTHRQARFSVQPVGALAIYFPTLTTQQNMNAPIPVPTLLARELADPLAQSGRYRSTAAIPVQ